MKQNTNFVKSSHLSGYRPFKAKLLAFDGLEGLCRTTTENEL